MTARFTGRLPPRNVTLLRELGMTLEVAGALALVTVGVDPAHVTCVGATHTSCGRALAGSTGVLFARLNDQRLGRLRWCLNCKHATKPYADQPLWLAGFLIRKEGTNGETGR